MHWFAKDIAKLNSKDGKKLPLDEVLLNIQPLIEGKNVEDSKKLAEKIRKTREATGKVFHSFEYAKAHWSFSMEFLRKNIEAIVVPN